MVLAAVVLMLMALILGSTRRILEWLEMVKPSPVLGLAVPALLVAEVLQVDSPAAIPLALSAVMLAAITLCQGVRAVARIRRQSSSRVAARSEVDKWQP
jgi:hypothetical protein